jgi:hypothetical protein
MIRIDPRNPKGIVWLTSYPKSGNTWVRAFIHALSHLIVGDPIDEIDPEKLEVLARSDLDARLYEKYLSGSVTEVDPHEIALARPKVQADMVRLNNGPILMKTHNARIEDGGAPLINESVTAGTIYVIRNPLDVAISFAHYRGVSVDQAISDMAEDGFGMATTEKAVYYVTTSWSEHVESWTTRPDPTCLVVRYEDMLDTPVETFSALANHIMMPHTREQLRHAIELCSFDKLRSAEEKTGYGDKSGGTDLFFREGRAGQWHEVLTQAQIDRIVADHGLQMARFGYLDDLQ